MEMLFALALPFIGSQGRARFRRKLQSLTDNATSATEFSTDGLPFHLDDDDAVSLGTAAQCSTHITKFHLDVSGLTVRGCVSLVPFLASSPSVTSVHLEGDLDTAAAKRSTGLVTSRLLQAIAANARITSVRLATSHFSPQSFGGLLSSAHLQKLVLADCWRSSSRSSYGRTISASAAQTVAQAVRSAPALRDLTLSALPSILFAALLQDGLVDHATLQELCLGLLPFAAAAAADSDAAATSLTIGRALRNVLDSSTPLTTLTISRSTLDLATLGPLVAGVQQCRTCRTLALVVCDFRAADRAAAVGALQQLFRANVPHLKEVFLTETLDTVDSLGDVLASLHRNTNLELLDISKGGFDGGSRHVRALLRRNRHLKRLDIDRNACFGNTAAVADICDGLAHNTTLTHFDASGCALGNAGTMAISTAVAQSNTVQNLLLCGNSLGLLGLAHILLTQRSLPQNSGRLTRLMLSGNVQLQDDGAMELAAFLRSTHRLEHLHVDECGITSSGFAALLIGAKDNATLVRLDMNGICLVDDNPLLACQALAECLPFLKLKNLGISVSQVPRGQPEYASRAMQDVVLGGLDKNESLVGVTMNGWFLDDSSQRKMQYYLLRNSVLPIVHKDSERVSGIWPTVLERLNQSPCGASAIFFCLQSRPDLALVTKAAKKTLPSPEKKPAAAAAATAASPKPDRKRRRES